MPSVAVENIVYYVKCPKCCANGGLFDHGKDAVRVWNSVAKNIAQYRKEHRKE